MTADIMRAVGGVGLFLFGMIWLTEGLRGLAGRTLRDVLARFTRTPLRGVVTGALTTAAIQSSSATTVTAVGFVGAGLLTFPQALGIIFGANIGTTITGWLVAILGFKLHLGEIVLPVVFLGALLRLFGGARITLLGTALAGFSLLFIGIDAMQAGVAGFEGVVTPTSFPGDTVAGRLQLVLIGALITLVTQSSSAGVATALAALGAGAISFPQAAAMVIGMDVGTTFKSALATLGGSTPTRRTGLSHVIYNLLTGVMAFLLLVPFAALVAPLVADGEAQIALVAFHSGFNAVGVVLVLPFTQPFARLVTALVPERGPQLTRRLDDRLLAETDAATDAAVGTVSGIARALFALLAHRLGAPPRPGPAATLRDISDALTATRGFVEKTAAGQTDDRQRAQIAETLHILDHLARLYHRLAQAERIAALEGDHRLRRLRNVLAALATESLDGEDTTRSEKRLNRFRRFLRAERRRFRQRTIALTSERRLEGETALLRLDAARWLHRVDYHLWRIRHHLNLLSDAGTPTSPLREAAVDVAQD